MIEQKFDEVPWTTSQTFLGIFLTLVPWVLISFGLSHLNGQPTRITPLPPQVDLTNAIVVFLFSILVEGAFLIAPFYFANRIVSAPSGQNHRRSVLRVLGFRSFSGASAVFWIITLFLAFLAINELYQYLILTFHLNLQTNDEVILQHSKDAPLTTYATLLAAVLVAPLCEEVFFRGFVLPGFWQGMPLGVAIVLSALLFAVAHADPGSFAVLFFIGLALAFIRWHTRSLWPCILLHMLNNGIAAIPIILYMHGSLH